MTKEKVQNKVQTIQWPKKKYKMKYRQSCLYFILYFFFGHWIVCTLYCTFSLVIGLSVVYFVLFLWSLDCLYFILHFSFGHWIVCTLLGTLPAFSEVRVTRSLVLCVCFVDRCLFFCTFSFGHYCVVCSSTYGFSLPLWYLQTLLNNMLVVSHFFYQGCELWNPKSICGIQKCM
jgi:hypothetical protein